MPELSRTPQANQIALVKLRDSSFWTWSAGRLESRVSNRPKGLNLSKRYKQRATTCTETKTSTHKVDLNGCKKETNCEARGCWKKDKLNHNFPENYIFSFTLFCKIVIPWYLKGLLNSMTWARSGFMVSGATIKSAYSWTNCPIKPFQSCFPVLLFRSKLPYSLKDKCKL